MVGEHTCERKQKRAGFRRRFCWRRTLPDDVDTSSLKAALTESNVLEIEAKKSKASESKIPITVRGRPGDQGKHNANNHLEHAQTIRQGESEKKEEEATVEIAPDEIEIKQLEERKHFVILALSPSLRTETARLCSIHAVG